MAKKKKPITAKKKIATKKTKKPAPASSAAQIKINSEVWPLERDVLFRPDRMKYVRKLIKPEGCVFCKAAGSEASFDTLCVFKSKHSMVVLNKFPYNSGHVLVLPQRHCGDLLKLSDEEYTDLQNTIRFVMAALHEAYQPGGINLGLNHGAVAGAGIPEHLHYHLIPRWAGDLNFFPLIAETKVLVESLEQTYDKLWSILKKYE
ncbi:HIT family protein [Bdellovibrio reynosensis]|uniref:HIT domain-containing protein n=1 Tax=Bdellovibrio reynosensis TaxID=2835041 RepID=A0ABY4CCZ2_9BACT|nr:HIT domain-containing protein [Bdellovibrio reynosensis]UOF02775.1 HIT domain-containing protein [Bdellovibrio reynosensis]